MTKTIIFFVTSVCLVISLIRPSFCADRASTRIVVRIVAKDAQVIGSAVGGALVRIKNMETGEVLAEGKQGGNAGNSERIMVQPHRRGETIYGTPGSAFFEAKIPLNRPTQIEIDAEAPLAYPHSIQKGSKTLTLIPGKDVLGEGVIIELNGLIVNVLSPPFGKVLKKAEELVVRAEVRML